jgi:CBS domain-containing protein
LKLPQTERTLPLTAADAAFSFHALRRCLAKRRIEMYVKSILADKGGEVLTIGSAALVSEAIALLAKHRIGALIVTKLTGNIAGILSERDIIRHIAEDSVSVLDQPVASIMTVNVKVCTENHSINEVMEIMTEGRFRHLPVEQSGKLIGVISIGDVVKRKIEEAEQEAEAIKNYIATG